MTLFKTKHSKSRYSEDIYTLDEIHQKHVKEFKKRKKLLPKKRKRLRDYKGQVANINKKSPSSYTINDIRLRAKLQTLIEQLEEEIYDIENDISETEYYCKTEDILMNYYDILDSHNNYHKSDDDYVENKTVSKSTKNKLDALDKINLMYRKKIKKKKPTKRRKNVRINNSVDIRKMFGCNIEETEKENKKKDRAVYLDQYRSIVESGYIPKAKRIFDPIKTCSRCENEKTLIHSDGNFVCESCGEVEMVVIESERPNYKEVIPEKPGYPYKRQNHYSEWLSQFQAKESTEIPKEVYDMILNELHKNTFYDLKKLALPYIKLSYMKGILKRLDLQPYYEHATHIISKLSGVPPPTISRETEERLKQMFRQIQNPFERHCPKSRINFLSYSYVLHKFCELLELDEFIVCFPLLKSKDKLRQQDKIWKKICKDLRWQFIPSI